MNLKRFSRNLMVITVAVAFLLASINLIRPVPMLCYIGLLFFSALTLTTFYISSMGIERDNKTFIKTFYGSFALRFFLSIGFLVIYLIFSPTKDLFFLSTFGACYLIFTIFEIYSLMIKLRPDLKNKQPSDE